MSSTWSDTDWRGRLTRNLEPLLKSPRLAAEISTYQGVPFALFACSPTNERQARQEIAMLAKRVENATARRVHILSMADEIVPLPAMIRERAAGLAPDKDLLVLTRVGALYPAYRASALLENLMGAITVPTILFYPGTRSGTNSLRFMDSLDALHSYRHKIY